MLETMNQITEHLKTEVIAEATLLRQNTTPEERERLLGLQSDFHPLHYMLCIYGLLTGNCFSKRAGELRKLSGTPMVAHSFFTKLEAYIVGKAAQNRVLIAYITGERDTLTIADL